MQRTCAGAGYKFRTCVVILLCVYSGIRYNALEILEIFRCVNCSIVSILLHMLFSVVLTAVSAIFPERCFFGALFL